MSRLGFRFAETMTGTYRLDADRIERAARFTVDLETDDALAYLANGRSRLVGRLALDGLATDVPIEGFLEIAPLLKRLRYEFAFVADDGRRYRFAGQKDRSLRRLLHSLTTLRGELLAADGARVGEATFAFDVRRDLGALVTSFRPRLASPR